VIALDTDAVPESTHMDNVQPNPAPVVAAPVVAPPAPAPVVVAPPPPAPVVVEPPKPVDPPKPAAPPAHDGHDVMRRALVRSEVVRVAERVGAIDADTVLALVADQFTVADDGRVVVSRDPRLSIEDHLRGYLASKPFLLRPLAPAGGSPAAAVVQPPQAPAPPDLTSASGLTELARKTAVALGLRRGV
jgi:hypothetical protein